MNGEATKTRGIQALIDGNRLPFLNEPEPDSFSPIASPPKADKPEPESEAVATARAAFQIAAILEGIEDRQVINVFRFVQSIRQTAKGETIQEIGEGLDRIARERRESERKDKPKSRWWRRIIL